MGVAGWTELQDNVTLVGTATANAYSGHDRVFNPLSCPPLQVAGK
jgi:hypothetical protein